VNPLHTPPANLPKTHSNPIYASVFKVGILGVCTT
jgi:hypothetical protein